jgi:hypothetical protein
MGAGDPVGDSLLRNERAAPGSIGLIRSRSADLNVPVVDEARVRAGQRPYHRQYPDQN